MGLQFFTGFEGCGTSADVQAMFTSTVNGPLYSATGGYNDGKCLRNTNSGGCYMTKNITGAKTVVAGHHRVGGIASVYNAGLSYSFLHFEGPKIRLFNLSTGIAAYRDTTLIGSCAYTINSDLHHVEAKVFSHASTGTVEVKVDGATVLTISGANTGGADITSVVWGMYGGSAANVDNLFIADDWKGELISYLLHPIADVVSDFTPSAGADNFAMVDDTASDGDSTYVSSATVGHQDLYGYTAMPAATPIAGVTVVTVGRKDDAGARVVDTIANQDATDYPINSISLGNTYPAAPHNGITTLAVAPDTTGWTATKLNSIKWGVEVTA